MQAPLRGRVAGREWVAGRPKAILYFILTLAVVIAGCSGYAGDPNSSGGGTNPPGTGPGMSGIQATSIGATTATISWTTSVAASSQVEYGTSTGYGSSTPNDSNMVTSHSVQLTGLSPSTLYYYRVLSRDASGNLSTSGSNTFTTAATSDTTAPTVSLTAPSNGATVSGTITVSANASDNVGVVGVQFKLNGNNLGSEDTSNPYSVSWNTSSVVNGSYTLTAAARDLAGNQTNSAAVTVNVSNTTPTGGGATGALLGAYALDEGTGTLAADRSGNNLNGTLTNGPSWTSGRFGQAVSFDGVASYVGLPSTLDIPAVPFTIEAWVNPRDRNNWRAIFSKRDSYSSGDMRLDVALLTASGRVSLRQPNSELDFSFAPPIGVWTHLVVVADTSSTSLYVNGLLQETLPAFTPGSDAAAKVNIGAVNNGTEDQFAGEIDEVRIYLRALTPSEVQGNLNAPVGGGAPPPPDGTAPTISAVASSGVTNAGATITWTTDEPSDSQVEYGTSTSYGQATTVAASLVISHNVILSGLNASTLYHYRVKSRDAAGNQAVSGDSTFTTAATPPPPPPPPTGSSLASLAASLQPGQWAELLTNNLGPTLSATGASGIMSPYANSAVWDPVTRQVLFTGGDHYGEGMKFAVYSEATNSWSVIPRASWMPTTDAPHGYDMNTIDTAGRRFYRWLPPRDMYRLDLTSNTWAKVSSISSLYECCTAVEYFPELGGVVGVMRTPSAEVSLFRESTGQWSTLANVTTADYHLFIEYNPVHKVVLFGGGNGNYRKIFRLSSSGSVTALRDAPANLGIASALVTADPVSGDYIVLTSGRLFYVYNVVTDTWTQKATSLVPSTLWTTSYAEGPVQGVIAAPIPTYGVIMYVVANDRVFLYKHAASSTPAPSDTTAPSVSISAPSGGATVSGTVTVSANASDNVGVVGVQFKLDGQNLGAEDTTAPYSVSWNTTTAANGSHALTAVARDAAGNQTTSTAVTVNVSNTDTAPPTISGVAAISVGSSSATITWTTNEASDSQVEYGVSTSYGQSTSLNVSLVTTHSVILSGLNAGTLYNYRVKSRDAAGNLAVSSNFTFTTSSTSTPPSGNSVALTVREPVATARTAEPVTSGVPFPGGAVGSLALFDASGNEVPVQVTRLQGKAAWFLLDFQTDLAASASKTFSLRPQVPTAQPATRITKNETSTSVTINTGPLEVTFRKDRFNLFETVAVNGSPVATSSGSNILITDHNGNNFFGDSAVPTRAEAEVDGPIRTTYRVDGSFVGWSGMGYTIRMTFYAGKTTVQIEYIIRNSLELNQRHVHQRAADIKLGSGTALVRATNSGSFSASGYASGGLTFTLVSSGEVANNGFVLPDWSYRGATVLVDFANPSSTEITRQLDAAKSPLMALAPAAWYSDNGELSTRQFATLEDERQTYRNWGLTWTSSQEPQDGPKPDFRMGWENIDVHKSLEADDLWQNLLMYLRTEGQQYGYFHRARAWARYYKWEYPHRTDGFEYRWDGNFEPNRLSRPNTSTGLTAADQTFLADNYEVGKIDSRGAEDFGADHSFGFGLADWYLLTGDAEALEALVDIGEVAQRMASRNSPGDEVAVFDLRTESRWFMTLERVWEMTQTPTWQARRDHIASLFQNASDWHPSFGMYVSNGGNFNSTCTFKQTYVSPFQPTWAAWALYRYYLDTGATWARDRLLAMGNFMDNFVVNPATGLAADVMFVDCRSAGDVLYPSTSNGYTVSTADVSVIAYRLDNNASRLVKAKERWNRGMCNIFPAASGTVCSFVNARFLSDGLWYYNNGYLSYGQLLLHDSR